MGAKRGIERIATIVDVDESHSAVVAFGCGERFLRTPDPPLNTEIDGILAKALAESEAPSLSVAVVQHGKLVYAKAVGLASLAPRRDASPDTRYAMGSISKEFTAAAILLEGEQGKIALDAKVSKYFPDLTRAGEITIRELLSHTSGYEDYARRITSFPSGGGRLRRIGFWRFGPGSR